MRILLVIAALALVALAVPAAVPSEARPAVQPERAAVRSAVADTLHASVRAGDALILSLPAAHDGRAAQYRLLEAPALSWLVDRSFFWRTLAGERGVLHVLIERTTAGAEPDTLVLAVELLDA